MRKNCPKCGWEINTGAIKNELECPQCGIIYAKYEAGSKRKSTAPEEPVSNKYTLTLPLIIICLILAGFFLPKLFKVSSNDTFVLQKTIGVEIDKASTLVFSQDCSQIAVSGYNKNLIVVDVQTGDILSSVDDAHVRRVLMSEFISRLYTSSWDSIKVWDSETGTPLAVLDAGGDVIETEFYGVVATNAETRTGKFIGTHMTGKIESFSVTPDENYLLSVSKQNKNESIAVWDLTTGQKTEELEDLNNALLAPDGQNVVVSEQEQVGKVDLGTSVKFKYQNTITFYSMPYLSRMETLDDAWLLSFSPDGSTLLVRTDEEEIVLRTIEGETLVSFPFTDHYRYSRFTKNGKFLLLSSGNSVSCFDVANGNLLWQSGMNFSEAGQVLQITQDDRFAVFSADSPFSEIRFVDIKTGKEWAKVKGTSAFHGFAISPDGRFLAAIMYKDQLAIWKIAD